MKDRSFFGIILILLGVGFLLDQFNIISFNNILSMYWPIILIALGILGLLKSKTSKIGNFLLIIFGIILQARNMDLIDINIYKLFFPFILIIVGINIIFSKNSLTRSQNGKNSQKGSLEDHIDEFVIMSGLETNVESQEFKGGKITSIMGGVELDLRDATHYNNEANIDSNAIMSGVEIFVPENWKIEHNGTPILGEFSNKKRYKEDLNAPVLRINFFVLMGSIEIK